MRDPMIEVYGEELFARYWAQWVDGMAALYNDNNANICGEILKDIKCPTFILYGEKDPIVDKVHATHLHTNITGSR
jgi:valacyclovir hydrolase